MGCCPSARDKKAGEESNRPYPQPQAYVQPAYQQGQYASQPATTASAPPGYQQTSDSQGAPPPYVAPQQPPQQVAYAQPPPQVVYAHPPPQTVVYQQPSRNSGGTGNTLLGAGAGLLGGLVLADALDGGLFD